MQISILLFGQTADLIGRRRFQRDIQVGDTVKKVIASCETDFPQLGRGGLLYALNESYAAGDEVVNDGDELAIFTAVSGG